MTPNVLHFLPARKSQLTAVNIILTKLNDRNIVGGSWVKEEINFVSAVAAYLGETIGRA
jgi:hypothetical protein